MTTVIKQVLTGSVDRAHKPVLRRIKGELISMAPAATMGHELIDPHQRNSHAAIGECWGCGAEIYGGRYCTRCQDEVDALRTTPYLKLTENREDARIALPVVRFTRTIFRFVFRIFKCLGKG